MKFNCDSRNNCTRCDYCQKCSHAFYTDTVYVNDKPYPFQFNPRFGMELLNENETQNEPDDKHPFWVEFQKWLIKNKFRG